MANILLSTNIYPLENVTLYGSTNVCQYFVKEWVKHGHNVRVVYNYSIFPRILHLIAKKFSNVIGNYFPTVINSERFNTSFIYRLDGIEILLNPIYRLAPKLKYTKSSLTKSIELITNWLDNESFNPDVVVGHFLQPNLQIIPELGKHYHCRTAIIAHGKYNYKRDFKLLTKNNNSIHLWGYRSYSIMKSFEKEFPHNSEKQFLCFSGIPYNFIDKGIWLKHTRVAKNNIIYVGNLINRKHPIAVLKAFDKSYFRENGMNLKFVGTGEQMKQLKKYTLNQHLQNQVHYLGRLPRDGVREEMLKSDIFVMISKDETFGLVYLEAMACGCIVIASRDEGMDGIIESGVNGFLCEAGNESELLKLLNHIYNLDYKQRQRIAKNAIDTILQMTDEKMAKQYLDALISIK